MHKNITYSLITKIDRINLSCIEGSNFDLMDGNSSAGDWGDSQQGGKRVLFEPGLWEDPLNDRAKLRECTKDCLEGGIGGQLPTEFPWTGAQ